MDRARYDAFVSAFFDCDPKALTGIFQEFLDVLNAQASLPPGHYLSQNYETAQANPEIHVLPGNAPAQVLDWAVAGLAKAGTLGIIGVYGPDSRTFPIGIAMNRNLTLKMGNCHHRKYIPQLIELVLSGRIDPAKVLTQVKPISDAIAAFEAFDQRQTGWVKVELQPQRQFLGTRVLLLVLREQHRRFQIGEPRSHHEIVRRQLQLQRLGPLDIGDVLVDQREDRDALEIDLLPPREIEQQVDRPFPPVEIEIERIGIVGRSRQVPAFGFRIGRVDRDRLFAHAAASVSANNASRLASRADCATSDPSA